MKSDSRNKPSKAAAPQNAGGVKLPKPNKGQEVPIGLSFNFLRSHKPPKRSA